jgi:alpha-amylase
MKVYSKQLNNLLLTIFLAAFATIRVDASSCTISPSTPTSGQSATITYNPVGGPLTGSSPIYIHLAINNWAPTYGPDPAMTLTNGVWTFTYTVPPEGTIVNCAFNNGLGAWDNNNNANWNFTVTPGAAPSPVPAPPPLPTNDSPAGVMMEGFYWNCPNGWYTNMAANAAALRNMQGGYGIDRIWFPPPQKSASGAISMGYDPYDYYDLGQYNQRGTIATHFGTQAQLKNAIAAYHAQGIVCLADLVLNHRGGGAAEFNPNLGGASSDTDFSGVASGMCTWHYNQFHPSTYEMIDEGTFGNYPDVCHVTGNTAGCAYYDLITWAKWLMNTNNAGFDGGWRFDYCGAYYPWVPANLRSNTANAFGVGEFSWDGNCDQLDLYVEYSGDTHAFDFPCYFTMGNVFTNGGSIAQLVDPSKVYAARNPSEAVTFVANHDTDNILQDKMLAYAFILTYQGYPCIFWHDYFNNGLSTLGGQAGNGINPLVWVRGALGGGQPSIQPLQTNDTNLLVYGTLNGTTSAPGYIVAINNNATSAKSTTVTTANAFLYGKTLQCYAWYSYVSGQNTQPADVSCSSSGVVTVQAPASGYAVYGPVMYSTPAALTGLSATGGNAQIVVSWTDSSGATSYNVKHSITQGVPFTTITAVATTAYTSGNLTNGAISDFVVSALNSEDESGNSDQARTRPVFLVPPVLGWGLDGDQLQFTWPSDYLGWHLESQTNTAGSASARTGSRHPDQN